MAWVVHARKRARGYRYRVFSTVSMDYMHSVMFYSEGQVAFELSRMEARSGTERNLAERMTHWLKEAQFATLHGNSEYMRFDPDACADGCRCHRHRIPNQLHDNWW